MDKKILNNLRENIGVAISNNLGLKIIAVLFAVFLWWTVVNVDDPIQTRKYLVEVSVLNPEVIMQRGKSFQVEDDTKQVTVTVEARRKVIEQIKFTNIVATADMREMQESTSTVPVRIAIPGFEGQYVSAKAYPQNIQVNVENTQDKVFPITAVVKGNVREGYVVAETVASPQSVEISGPESIVKKISKVVAQVDVSGLAADRDIKTGLVFYDAADNEIPQTYLTTEIDEAGVDVTVRVWKTKVVDVVFDTSAIVPSDGYLFNGIEYEPQSIEIAANAEVLNTLEKIEIPAEALKRDGVTESEQVIVDLSKYLPSGVILVDKDATTAVVEIMMEQIGTRNFSIPVRSVQVIGLAEDMQLLFGPEQSLAIVFNGRSDDLSKLTEGGFVASIDLTECSEPGEYEVPVIVSEQPEGCNYIGDAKIKVTLSPKEAIDAEDATP